MRTHTLIYAYALPHPHPHLTLPLPLTRTLPRTAYALIAIPILFGVQIPGFEGEFGNLNSASAVSVEVLNCLCCQ